MPFQHDSILVKSSHAASPTYLLSYGGENSSGIWTNELKIFALSSSAANGDDASTRHTTLNSLRFEQVTSQELSLKKDGHKMFCYQNRILLFSGLDNQYYSPRNQIYELTPASDEESDKVSLQWNEVLNVIGAKKPDGRRLFGLQLVGNLLFVAGGKTAQYRKSTIFSDTWCLDLEKHTWMRMESELPVALAGITLSHDPKRQRLLCFGGIDKDGEYSNKMYEFSLKHKQWRTLPVNVVAAENGEEVSVPSPRERHTALVESTSDALYIFGGWGEGGCKNDLWRFDLKLNTWHQISEHVPSVTKRYGHTSALSNGLIWVYGGKTSDWKNIDSIDQISSLTELRDIECSSYEAGRRDAKLPCVEWLDRIVPPVKGMPPKMLVTERVVTTTSGEEEPTEVISKVQRVRAKTTVPASVSVKKIVAEEEEPVVIEKSTVSATPVKVIKEAPPPKEQAVVKEVQETEPEEEISLVIDSEDQKESAVETETKKVVKVITTEEDDMETSAKPEEEVADVEEVPVNMIAERLATTQDKPQTTLQLAKKKRSRRKRTRTATVASKRASTNLSLLNNDLGSSIQLPDASNDALKEESKEIAEKQEKKQESDDGATSRKPRGGVPMGGMGMGAPGMGNLLAEMAARRAQKK